jgi:hypothetical protein
LRGVKLSFCSTIGFEGVFLIDSGYFISTFYNLIGSYLTGFIRSCFLGSGDLEGDGANTKESCLLDSGAFMMESNSFALI